MYKTKCLFLGILVLLELKIIHSSYSRLFINAVWEPFVAIEDFLFSLMTLQESEQIDYVSDNWKQVSQELFSLNKFI